MQPLEDLYTYLDKAHERVGNPYIPIETPATDEDVSAMEATIRELLDNMPKALEERMHQTGQPIFLGANCMIRVAGGRVTNRMVRLELFNPRCLADRWAGSSCTVSASDIAKILANADYTPEDLVRHWHEGVNEICRIKTTGWVM